VTGIEQRQRRFRMAEIVNGDIGAATRQGAYHNPAELPTGACDHGDFS
jgi:hypothetical protein